MTPSGSLVKVQTRGLSDHDERQAYWLRYFLCVFASCSWTDVPVTPVASPSLPCFSSSLPHPPNLPCQLHNVDLSRLFLPRFSYTCSACVVAATHLAAVISYGLQSKPRGRHIKDSHCSHRPPRSKSGYICSLPLTRGCIQTGIERKACYQKAIQSVWCNRDLICDGEKKQKKLKFNSLYVWSDYWLNR